MSSIKTKKV